MSSNTDEDNNDDNDQHGGSGKIITLSKEECTSCEQNNNVDNITDGIDSVAIQDDMSICAACGKESNDHNMNTCNKCKMVNIVMRRVKRSIDQNTKRHVIKELPNYMMRSYSKSPRLQRSVQFAFYLCNMGTAHQLSCHAVASSYAVVVFMK